MEYKWNWVLDSILFSLTLSIAVMAIWMAAGLLRKQSWRIDNLIRIGLVSPAWPFAFGVGLITAAAGLIVGVWITPIGIVSIVVIKVTYLVIQIGYRRANVSRQRGVAHIIMTGHTVAGVIILCLLIAK
jgi:hypothetical protein